MGVSISDNFGVVKNLGDHADFSGHPDNHKGFHRAVPKIATDDVVGRQAFPRKAWDRWRIKVDNVHSRSIFCGLKCYRRGIIGFGSPDSFDGDLFALRSLDDYMTAHDLDLDHLAFADPALPLPQRGLAKDMLRFLRRGRGSLAIKWRRGTKK